MTVTELSFFAYGNPAAQGNHTRSASGHIYDHNKNLKPWREAVIHYAREHYQGPPLDGPLELQVTFWFPRPKSAKRNARYKTTAPDLDKLCRGLGDALEIAGTIASDARIVRWTAEKRLLSLFVSPQQNAMGAYITISVLDGEVGR